jgi:hypothetical protein
MVNEAHYKGAFSEHLVASHFLKEGCEVYWPSSSQSKADFVVDYNGSLKKIQVKTMYNLIQGDYEYWQCRLYSSNKCRTAYTSDDFDYLAAVTDYAIYLFPFEKIEGKRSITISKASRLRNWNPEEFLWVRLKEVV